MSESQPGEASSRRSSRGLVEESPRLVLALKVRRLRLARRETLQTVAGRAGLSVSYLSEIERGKKYPKPERLLRLAEALEVPFDELVSLRLEDELAPFEAALASPLLGAFPFSLFGLEPEDVLALVADDPERGSALLRAVAEVGRSYDVHVEHFLHAALRAYQQLHGNHFEDLEQAAVAFRRKLRVAPENRVEPEVLIDALRARWGIEVDRLKLGRSEPMSGLRSVFKSSEPRVLCINPLLMPSQESFVLAREIGYQHLGLGERASSSPWVGVDSFPQVFNNFRASYFAGALIMDRARLRKDLEILFSERDWKPERLLGLLDRYGVTAETFLHRLTQIVPRFFGVSEYYFLRFTASATTPGERVRLTKWLNTTAIPVPRGFGLSEHFCRRWPALGLLTSEQALREPGDDRLVSARRVTFVDERQTYLELTMARPMALTPDAVSAVSVGLRLDEKLRRTILFAEDPSVKRIDVSLTCERCRIDDCSERVAAPTILEGRLRRSRMISAIEALTSGS